MEELYKNIFKSRQLTNRSKFKNLLYYFLRKRGAKKSWTNRHQKVFERNRSYNTPCRADLEMEHQKKWGAFREKVDLSTLRICKNISGCADPRIIPEDIFVSDIEPTLISDEAGRFQSHKSFYNHWFPEGVFPSDFFHCINGQYLDSNLNPICFDELKEQARNLSYPVVIKPNWQTYGGKDVFFPINPEKLVSLCERSNNFVVQECIEQHAFFDKYNPVGLNTIRLYTYRSVNDNSLNVLSLTFRMGCGGSLDNETDGGIHTKISRDGSMNGYAVDKFGEKYFAHPDTGYKFNEEIPDLDELKAVAKRISEQIFFSRIIGLDLCYDKNGKWRVIEVNTHANSIRLAQYGGQPFLREFTDEVIEYCIKKHWALNNHG